jgi:RNA polymerase II subunit A small phosphatase-like protein
MKSVSNIISDVLILATIKSVIKPTSFWSEEQKEESKNIPDYCDGEYCVQSAHLFCAICNFSYCNNCFRLNHNHTSGEQSQYGESILIKYNMFQENCHKQKLLVVLDLDQTLLHGVEQSHYDDEFCSNYNFSVLNASHYIYLRPYLKTFLSALLLRFQVAVWTAASQEYCDEIVEKLFPKRDDLLFVYSSHNTSTRYNTETGYHEPIKALKKIKDKRKPSNLKRVVVIDDNNCTFQMNFGNGILIPKFNDPENQRTDTILLHLLEYLDFLDQMHDVTRIEKRGWLSRYQKTS